MLVLPADDSKDETGIHEAVKQVYSFGLAHGGAISGEHGIGLLQKEFMSLQYTDAHLNILKQIKSVFDPNGILNPGKIYH